MNNIERIRNVAGMGLIAAASFVPGCGYRITNEPTPNPSTGAGAYSGQRESIVDHEMKPGERFRARSGSMIKGDVLVNGVRLFDDNRVTGLIVELHEDADITAPWGANVSEVGADQTTRNAVFGQAVEEMKAKGCVDGKGCERVDVVKFPGGKPQGR